MDEILAPLNSAVGILMVAREVKISLNRMEALLKTLLEVHSQPLMGRNKLLIIIVLLSFFSLIPQSAEK